MKNKRRIITQIGSLPYKDVKQAVRYSLKHDIPFVPELPLLGDSMMEYIKNPGHLSCLAEFKKYTFEVVKGQVVGPSTLVMAGYEPSDAVDRINRHAEKILDGLKAKEIILILDEPALGQAGFDFEELWAPIFESLNVKVVRGVHCCGNMDWDKLFQSKLIEIISFDASQFDITKYHYYRNGKLIAWGVKELSDVKDFQPGDLLTLPCGMGTKLYTVKDCEKNFKKLKAIARNLEKKRRES